MVGNNSSLTGQLKGEWEGFFFDWLTGGRVVRSWRKFFFFSGWWQGGVFSLAGSMGRASLIPHMCIILLLWPLLVFYWMCCCIVLYKYEWWQP